MENYRIENRPEVKSLGEWNDRVYVNLKAAQRSFRGDQTSKVYINNVGAVVFDSGRGTVSPGMKAALVSLRAWLVENEVEVIG